MTEIILRALATYSLAVVITNPKKDGFLGIFKIFRETAVSLSPEKYKSNIETGVTCPVCAGFWIGALMLVLPLRIVRWLALAGFVVLVEEIKPIAYD